jgi:NAD(P)-dependent dehydrogenase (short-subunit alcohol dehydrogenase family)
MLHPAFADNNVAVITGAADGIGLAAAKKYASMGMRVCMADSDAEKLAAAAAAIPGALAVATDVSDMQQVESLRHKAYAEFGQVDVLMNNAGIGAGTGCWSDRGNWQQILQVNLWGVINGVQAFTAAMLEQQTPGVIINTGSKQGITCPPGNPAYNVSKAGIKTLTEALQHELRNTDNCQLSAHLLVPGFTYTGMIAKFIPQQPPAAWSPAQVIDFLLQSVNAGDFYILCPDNDVDRAADNKRMSWAMGDLIHNRPPLSRWHPDFAQAFESYQPATQTSANDD